MTRAELQLRIAIAMWDNWRASGHFHVGVPWDRLAAEGQKGYLDRSAAALDEIEKCGFDLVFRDKLA